MILWRWHLNYIVEFLLEEWDWCVIQRLFSLIDLHPLNEEFLNLGGLVSPNDIAYVFPWFLYILWNWYFHSLPLFVSFMHLSITHFWSFAWQGEKEVVMVKRLSDKGSLERLSKYYLETRETWDFIFSQNDAYFLEFMWFHETFWCFLYKSLWDLVKGAFIPQNRKVINSRS